MKNQSVGKRIGVLSRATHTFFQYKFKNFSIGHAQVLTLHFISLHDGISQNELVRYFGMDKSSITSQIKMLEKNGYIIRKIHEKDSRGRRIFITDKTQTIKPELHKIFSSWSEFLLHDFSEDEKGLIFQFLDKMIENAQKTLKELKEDEENK